MIDRRRLPRAGWFLLLFLLSGPVFGQGTKADYERATSLAQRTENKVFRHAIKPNWLLGQQRFWYRVPTGATNHEFVLVDSNAGTRRPMFDHARLASALTSTLGRSVAADALPLERVELEAEASFVTFRADRRAWRVNLQDYTVAAVEGAEETLKPKRGDRIPRRSRQTGEEVEITFVNATRDDIELFWLDTEGERRTYGRVRAGQERQQHTFAGHVWLVTDRVGTTLGVFEAADAGSNRAVIETESPATKPETPDPSDAGAPSKAPGESPDGKWVASVKDHQVVLRNQATGESRTVSADGAPDDAYQSAFSWAPDSSRVVARRVRRGASREVQFVEAAPREQLQPRLHSHRYLKPGDVLPKPMLVLFNPTEGSRIDVPDESFPNPFTEDGDLDIRWAPDSREFFINYNQRGHQLYRILAVHAVTGVVRTVVEEAGEKFIDWTEKTWRYWLDKTGELLWMSEREGWCHLWLYDVATGRVKNAVTRGEWVVRRVEHVDEDRRQVWFYASGVRLGQDPYYLHLCRANFDGTDFVILTEGDGTHKVTFSPDRACFIDTWSRVDQPPVIELRRSSDGSRICELERADWTELLAAGWSVPERFAAKGRDGLTDIFGIIVRPSGFDPAKRYPVIEEIYAGPQGSFVPKEFSRLNRQHSLAELGFVVVQIDGMGTDDRGRKFHEIAWKNLRDAGFPDRIAWLKAAASTRPWMDLSRVGIYGGSAGGQNALRGLLDHPDFYQAGVADCGCHDNRMDKIWWNEQWLGWPVDESYARSSNVEDAAKLQGRLLLVVGELDTNVDPASTLQVAAALVRAGKDFDLLIMPGTNHGAAETPYASRRRMDFFVRHLLGREARSELVTPAP